jgi:ATP-dependent protease ClpP protease subunit
MKKSLFNILSESTQSEELTPTAPVSKDENTPADKQITEDNFVACQRCAYQIIEHEKRVNVWLFGVLSITNDYLKLISLLHTVTDDFVIHIYIHSPGGSIAVGSNILTAMARCKAQIVTHNIGIAASCGSLILSFGDKIEVADNSITMFHNALQGSRDSVHRLLSQTQHTITMVMDLFTRMKNIGVITEEEIEGIVKRGEEYYLTAPTMVQRLKAANIWYDGGK